MNTSNQNTPPYFDSPSRSIAAKPKPKPKEKCLKFRVLFFTFISMIMIASIFNYGTINIYIAKRFSPSTYLETSTYTMLVFPLWLTSQTLSTQLFRLHLMQKLGLRTTIFTGFSLFATTNWAAAYLPSTHSFILLYSIGSGTSLGLVSSLPPYLL